MEGNIYDTFIWCHKKKDNYQTQTNISSECIHIIFQDKFYVILYPVEGKIMAIYMEFCKVILNQRVIEWCEKQLINHSGKISQIKITANTEIWTEIYHKEYIQYERTERYNKRNTQQKCVNKKLSENFWNLNLGIPSLHSGTHLKFPRNWFLKIIALRMLGEWITFR